MKATLQIMQKYNHLCVENFHCSLESSGLHIRSWELHTILCNRLVGKALLNVLINTYDPVFFSDQYNHSDARENSSAHPLVLPGHHDSSVPLAQCWQGISTN